MTTPDAVAAPDECWPLDLDCLGAEWAGYPPETQAKAAALAVASLRRLTLYRVGGCPITVRMKAVPPCGTAALPGYGGVAYGWGGNGGYYPAVRLDGQWVNGGGCCPPCSLDMAGYVGRVDSITVGGVPVDLAHVVIEDDRYLVWTGTATCPFTDAETLVTYLPAREPDVVAAWMAGTLAAQFAKACCGAKCDLPTNVRTLARQGVTQTLVTGMFPKGQTGIKEIDAWVATFNPNGLTSRPSVYAPGMPETVIRRPAQ